MIASTAAEAAVISSIVVTGNTRIDAETVRNYVLIEPGRSFGGGEIDESVKALYGTGLFADVTITVSGSRLVVNVVENPIVNTVVIRGNKKIKNDVLLQILQTEPRGVLTDAKLQGDVQRITEYYASQGRGEATVESIVTPLGDNRADVVFQINEGGRTAISRVSFVGNNAFSDSRLSSVVESKRRSVLTLLSRKDIFNEGKLAQDQEELRNFYMSHGYADFRVISVDWEFNEANNRYTVVFTVEEGPKYRFSTIDMDSTVPGLDPNSLRRFITTKPGRVFNSSEIERTIEAMSLELSRTGYSFAQVRPRGDRNYSNNTISVTYLIDEGPRLYIERIDIYGNTKTRDYVIRREFDLAEGDAYNRVLIDRAERKLRDLQFFKTVSITTEPGSAPDKVIVVVQVEEESTGEFSVGAGLSTEGIVAELSLDERNFLGRGQHLRISVGFGQDEQTYNISFTDPYFLGQNISAGVDAFKIVQRQTSYRPYDFDAIGGGVRLGLPITDRLTLNTNYRYKNQEITNSKKSTRMYFPEGTTIVSSVGYGFVYSSLDSRVTPREGYYRQPQAGVRRCRWRRVLLEVGRRGPRLCRIDARCGHRRLHQGRGRQHHRAQQRAGRDHRQLLQGWRDRPRFRQLRIWRGRQGDGYAARRQELLGDDGRGRVPVPRHLARFRSAGRGVCRRRQPVGCGHSSGRRSGRRPEHHPVVGRWLGAVGVADRCPPCRHGLCADQGEDRYDAVVPVQCRQDILTSSQSVEGPSDHRRPLLLSGRRV